MNRDFDGDGYPTLEPETRLVVCEDEALPAGYSGEPSDCDDEDPSVWQWICIDQDGDDAYATLCVGSDTSMASPCPVILEWTPEAGPYDCDDSDPGRIDYFYRDEDGDGVGAGSAECWHAEAGWSAWSGDCDDQDPTLSPRAFEVVGDGIDSDCSGADETTCLPGPFDEFTWPTSEEEAGQCVGTNLALGWGSCSSCQRTNATLAVANRGDTLFDGEVSLEGEELPPLSMTVRLGPGEETIVLGGPIHGSYRLLVNADPASDCSPGDNSAYVPRGHCL